MNDPSESGLDPLEARLRHEAQAMFACNGRRGSAAALQAEFRRRRRVRRVRLAGATTGVAAACMATLLTMWRSEENTPSIPTMADRPPSSVNGVVKNEPVTLQEQMDHVAVESDSPQPRASSAGMIPFLITGTDENGREVIAVGVYVPPRVERVNLHDLPALQQAAVRRVLDLEEEIEKPTI